jgi:seryl-tRNA(Sec) selenium transferase
MLAHSRYSANELAQRLRGSNTPVVARIINDKVAVDLRTVAESEEDELIAALNGV